MLTGLVWSGVALVVLALFVVLRALIRLRRWGRRLSSEERRLRDDPRFTEMWVKQYQPPSSAVTGEDAGSSRPIEAGTADPARPDPDLPAG